MGNNYNNISVTNDLMFQHIFGKVGNEKITKNFLEKILGIKINSLTLNTNKRMQGKWLDDKIGRLDVKAELDDGTVVTIEMQVAYYKQMGERLLFYWSEAYIETLKKGNEYNRLHKTISILISVENLKFTEGIDDYHTIWELREKNHHNKKLTNDLEIHVIELGKFDNRKKNKPEDNWIKFIKAKGAAEMKELSKIDKELAEAVEEFNRLIDDPEKRDDYEWRIRELRDKISFATGAKEDGIEEGLKQRKKRRNKIRKN